MYDLLIGLENLAHWKVILNFQESTVTIDHVELPMQSLGDLSDAALNNIYKEAQEPSISHTATKRVTQIIDPSMIRQTYLKLSMTIVNT